MNFVSAASPLTPLRDERGKSAAHSKALAPPISSPTPCGRGTKGGGDNV